MEDEKVVVKNDEESETLPHLQSRKLACYNPFTLSENMRLLDSSIHYVYVSSLGPPPMRHRNTRAAHTWIDITPKELHT